MHLISLAYEGHPITIRDDGWFNATQAASGYSKEPFDWLVLRETVVYVAALAKRDGNSGILQEFNKIKDLDAASAKSKRLMSNLVKRSPYVKTKAGAPANGGGTWLHPKLAVPFSRWLDVDFSIWCDTQIDDIIRGKQDWRRARHISAVSSKVLSAMVKDCREADGKETLDKHYMCEHKLVNWLLTGQFKGLVRDNLAGWQLDFLGHFDLRDGLLIARGVGYDKRKEQLVAEAAAWKAKNAHRILGSNDPGALAA